MLFVVKYTAAQEFFILYLLLHSTRVGTLIVATIYLQLIENRYMF